MITTQLTLANILAKCMHLASHEQTPALHGSNLHHSAGVLAVVSNFSGSAKEQSCWGAKGHVRACSFGGLMGESGLAICVNTFCKHLRCEAAVQAIVAVIWESNLLQTCCWQLQFMSDELLASHSKCSVVIGQRHKYCTMHPAD